MRRVYFRLVYFPSRMALLYSIYFYEKQNIVNAFTSKPILELNQINFVNFLCSRIEVRFPKLGCRWKSAFIPWITLAWPWYYISKLSNYWKSQLDSIWGQIRVTKLDWFYSNFESFGIWFYIIFCSVRFIKVAVQQIKMVKTSDVSNFDKLYKYISFCF